MCARQYRHQTDGGGRGAQTPPKVVTTAIAKFANNGEVKICG